MRTNFRFSIIAILSVLYASVATSSYAASSVRALGGSGTFSSASSAASAKTTKTSNTSSGGTRAGAMRVGNATRTGTRTSSTRGASSTPRLSIGKYLGGSTSVSGGSSTKPINPGQSGSTSDGTDTKLKEQVEALGQFMGYSETGTPIKDIVADLDIDVKSLQADLSQIKGELITVDYANGILTVAYPDGEKTEFDLANDFATNNTVTALQAAVDSIVIPDVSGFLTSADLTTTNDAIKALQDADTAMDAAIRELQAGGTLNQETFNQKIAALEQIDSQLQASINDLSTKIPSIDGLVNQEYVDGLINELRLADTAINDAIAAIKQPDVDKAYVDAAIAGIKQPDVDKAYVDTAIIGLNTSIDALVAADATMSGLIDDLSTRLDVATTRLDATATKDELNDGLDALRAEIDKITTGDIDLLNYYTRGETNEIFLTKTDAENIYATSASVSELSSKVDTNITNISELDESVQIIVSALGATTDIANEAKAAAAAAQQTANTATELATLAQTAADTANSAAALAQQTANQNTADITEIKQAGYITNSALEPYAKTEDLATVAKTGSYNDLTDTPTLITQSDLDLLRSALELKIEEKQNKGDYATTEYLNQVKETLETLKKDTYTKTEIDNIIKEAIEEGEIDLTGYATTAMLNEMGNQLSLLINNKVDKDGLGQLAYLNQVGANDINTGDVQTGEMAMLLVDENGQHSWVSVVVAVP